MQRIIKFRGKRVDNGEWVYGSLRTDYLTQQKESGLRMCFIYNQDRYNLDLNDIKVYPETVGQFTGLTDKNGKEIYEGDIINVTNKGIYNGNRVVVFDESLLCYVLVWAELIDSWNGTQHGTTFLKVSSGIKCNLIGNIHENPELCKG